MNRGVFVFDPAFREAFENVPHVILGRELRPFCLWHRLCLEMLNSPLLAGGEVSALDLYSAVVVCQSEYGYIPDFAPPKGPIQRYRFGRMLRRVDVAKGVAQFLEYFKDFDSSPKLWPDENEGNKRANMREMDELLETAAHVIRETGWDEKTVWELPLGKAKWYSVSFLKLQGVDVPFWTPQDEARFKQHVAEREAKLAKDAAEFAEKEGVSVEAALEAVTKKYWEKVREQKHAAKMREKLQHGR